MDPNSKIHRLLKEKKRREAKESLEPGGLKDKMLQKADNANTLAKMRRIIKFMIKANDWKDPRG